MGRWIADVDRDPCGILVLTLKSVSAGFATVHGNNSLTINAVEAYELDKFSLEVSRAEDVVVMDER